MGNPNIKKNVLMALRLIVGFIKTGLHADQRSEKKFTKDNVSRWGMIRSKLSWNPIDEVLHSLLQQLDTVCRGDKKRPQA